MKSLKNKNIVITGGIGFLGKYFCEAISQNGGNPIILEKKINKFENYLNQIKFKYGNNPTYYRADITKINDIRLAYKKILKKYKNVHGLVNNAAKNPKLSNLKKENLLENFNNKVLLDEFNVGIIGALNCIKVFGPHFSKNKYGSIVNISSDLGLISPNHSIYNESVKQKIVKPVSYSIIKHGLIGLTKYVSTYWSKNNVRCNALAPGGVFENHSKKFVKKISTLVPLYRMANPEELKEPLVFLLSEESSYINGHTLVVDGGRTIW